MNADKRGYSMRCLHSPAHQKDEWLRCINGMYHLHSSAFICGQTPFLVKMKEQTKRASDYFLRLGGL
jgi:hypothetical protein